LALDDLSTGQYKNIESHFQNPQFSFIEGSIRDEKLLDRLMCQSSVVVHLAAMVGVQLIVEQPLKTLETNVMGTHAVLQSAAKYGCRVLLASTSEVYGKGLRIPFAEQDDVVLGPTSKSRWGYAAGKMVDEFMALAFHQERELEAVIFRLFNTVGPRQSAQYGMVIPRFVRQALSGDPITIFGDGTQSRCFCDVRDVVRGIMGLANHSELAGQVFNIGGTEEITIGELAQLVKQLTHSDSPLVTIPYSDAYPAGFEDMQRRVPDTSLIENTLAWKPRYNLREILLDVIEHERRTMKIAPPIVDCAS
jgi:UDP-glucose 4-epimerase